MAGAGLGNRSLPTLDVTRALGWHQAKEPRKQCGLLESMEVAYLGGQARCCERVDATKAAQSRDRLGMRAGRNRLLKRAMQRASTLHDLLDCGLVVQQRRRRARIFQTQRTDPVQVSLSPRAARPTKSQALTQQELREAVASAHQGQRERPQYSTPNRGSAHLLRSV